MELKVIESQDIPKGTHPLHVSPKMIYLLKNGLFLQFTFSEGKEGGTFFIHDQLAGKRYKIDLIRDPIVDEKPANLTAKVEVVKEASPATQAQPAPAPSLPPPKPAVASPAPQAAPSRVPSAAPPPSPAGAPSPVAVSVPSPSKPPASVPGVPKFNIPK